jgi:hypothetical protein
MIDKFAVPINRRIDLRVDLPACPYMVVDLYKFLPENRTLEVAFLVDDPSNADKTLAFPTTTICARFRYERSPRGQYKMKYAYYPVRCVA